MSKFLLTIVSIMSLGLLLSACLPGGGDQDQSVVDPAEVVLPAGETGGELTSDEIAQEAATSFTLEEVALRGEPDNCWTVIDGIVYDLTTYIASATHPGGAEILAGCGIDATELFESRPGSGTPHSAAARAGLARFEIGVLE